MALAKSLTAAVAPNRYIGPFALGATLHSTLTKLKAQPSVYPEISLTFDEDVPIQSPVIVGLPLNGLRLRFDGSEQRLRLIEVVDFSKIDLTYKNVEIVKSPSSADEANKRSSATAGPTFRQVYNKLFGPTFQGEYVAPKPQTSTSTGTYILSYPGVAFSFPLQASAWYETSDFVSLLSSSAASPAISMAIYSGSAWPEVRDNLYDSFPDSKRYASPTRSKEHPISEIEVVKIHGAGRLELIRRSIAPFWIVLNETSPQDLIAEIGPPDSIYRKRDRRISIHGARSASQSRSPARRVGIHERGESGLDSDHSSLNAGVEESEEEDHQDQHAGSTSECFYNYFHLGFDLLMSSATVSSLQSPTAKSNLADSNGVRDSEYSSTPTVVTKIILHGNVPGSYSFNRHCRCRWTLEHVPWRKQTEPLTSEMRFAAISPRLKDVWRSTYASEEDEKSSQRGMVLNRGWGDSPGSSCELLGGFDDSIIEGKKTALGDSTGLEGQKGLGNTELYGFPGLVFEVLKNDAVSCLTVY